MKTYRVALWPTRLSPLPVDTLDIEAETPRLAALMAMQLQGSDAMGVVVAMDSEKQYTFFDAEWRGDALHFSKQETLPRLGANPFIENSKKWKA